MNRRTLLQSLPAVALLANAASGESMEKAKESGPSGVYELRVYHAAEGKLPDLLARFRDHTTKLFEKHGMRNVAYWTPTDDPLKSKTLFYILGFPSREAATKSWQTFRDDPEWIKVKDKSEANGKLVDSIDSTFLTLTDFSPSA